MDILILYLKYIDLRESVANNNSILTIAMRKSENFLQEL